MIDLKAQPSSFSSPLCVSSSSFKSLSDKFIISSIVFYKVLESNIPLSIYVACTFCIGLSSILELYECKNRSSITAKDKIWFYSNTVLFIILVLHFIQSGDRTNQIINDFNWSDVFITEWTIFIPFGYTIGILMFCSTLMFRNPFFPLIDMFKRITGSIKKLFHNIRNYSGRDK